MSKALFSEQTWRGYCRNIALGRGESAVNARLCLLIGGTTPAAGMIRLADLRRRELIDDDTLATRELAIDMLADMYRAGTVTMTMDTPINDWVPLGGGAHARRAHRSL